MKKHILFAVMVLAAILMTAMVGCVGDATKSDDDAVPVDDDTSDDDNFDDDTGDDDVDDDADDDTGDDDDTNMVEITSPAEGSHVTGETIPYEGKSDPSVAGCLSVKVEGDVGGEFEIGRDESGYWSFSLGEGEYDLVVGNITTYVRLRDCDTDKIIGSANRSVWYDGPGDDDTVADDDVSDDDDSAGEPSFTFVWNGTHTLIRTGDLPVYPGVEYTIMGWAEIWNPTPTEFVPCTKFSGPYGTCSPEDDFKVLLQY